MNVIHWFREDLRLNDNKALHYAASKRQLIAVYIFPPELGGASYWWLHHSLVSLQSSLQKRGVKLVLRTGNPDQVLAEIVRDHQVDLVTWNRVYSPTGMTQGQQVKEQLANSNIACESFNSEMLIEPSKIANKQGSPFKVFTPFWRHCRSLLNPPEPLPTPDINASTEVVESEDIQQWDLLPTRPNWAQQFEANWFPGESGAHNRWHAFLESGLDNYQEGRDIPSKTYTSMLSPHLHFGEIGPNQIWHELQAAVMAGDVTRANADKFLSELGWREFSRYLMVHFENLESTPFNTKFENFPWEDDEKLLKAWQRGLTGYPIVDAGMRQLWETGYMHNRVRMIVASFLTKHCLCHWTHGMKWFWDTLLDADTPNNVASWQWVAGCGADAAPYFRIFNPTAQGEKFDKQGDYVKQWVPELANMPAKYIHKPWEASEQVLAQAKVVLGGNYPKPIVDHKQARARALAAYAWLKDNTSTI